MNPVLTAITLTVVFLRMVSVLALFGLMRADLVVGALLLVVKYKVVFLGARSVILAFLLTVWLRGTAGLAVTPLKVVTVSAGLAGDALCVTVCFLRAWKLCLVFLFKFLNTGLDCHAPLPRRYSMPETARSVTALWVLLASTGLFGAFWFCFGMVRVSLALQPALVQALASTVCLVTGAAVVSRHAPHVCLNRLLFRGSNAVQVGTVQRLVSVPPTVQVAVFSPHAPQLCPGRSVIGRVSVCPVNPQSRVQVLDSSPSAKQVAGAVTLQSLKSCPNGSLFRVSNSVQSETEQRLVSVPAAVQVAVFSPHSP